MADDIRSSSDCEPGITRRRVGKGFVYLGRNGRALRDPRILARIRQLAIPPAYGHVWICSDARGHLQATARDAQGRKQYRYHPHWRELRSARKYRRLLRFGERLPDLRARLRRDLRQTSSARDRALATVVKVMLATSIRIGNAEYMRDNHSYGLTTLRVRHVRFKRDGCAIFHFRAKAGKVMHFELRDRALVRHVKACARLPGPALFQYQEDNTVHEVTAAQVNEYLRGIMGERFSAKDFRTWTGTMTVIACLARVPQPPPQGGLRARRAVFAQALAAAAQRLGNTTTVCQQSYVCPAVFAGWEAGMLSKQVSAASRGVRLEKDAIRFLGACLDRFANARRSPGTRKMS